MIKRIFFFVLIISFSYITKAQTVSKYKINDRIHLDGNAGWDYLSVDDIANRLYVSHGNMVQVVDITTNKLVGTIPDTKGVHGIAIASDLNKGFISDGRDSTVTIFDLMTLKTITKIKVTGRNPDAILYDPFSHKVFVYNGGSANATVIDAKLNKVIATIQLSGKPEFSVTNNKGLVYVNIEDKNQIAVINATTLKVEKYFEVKPGDEPSGLALDVANNRLFAVCGNKLMVVLNAETGNLITTLPIGDRVDGVAFDAGMKRIYSSNGEGTMTVISQEDNDKYTVLENVPTQIGARTIAVNPKTHHIYLPCSDFEAAPKPTKDNPRPRPVPKPNSFTVLDVVVL